MTDVSETDDSSLACTEPEVPADDGQNIENGADNSTETGNDNETDNAANLVKYSFLLFFIIYV